MEIDLHFMEKQSELFPGLKERGLILSLAENALPDSCPAEIKTTLLGSSKTYPKSGIVKSDGRTWTVNTSPSVFHRIEGATNEELGEQSLKGGCECLYLGLSSILEQKPLKKYSLSSTACQGILRRAEKRGKLDLLTTDAKKGIGVICNESSKCLTDHLL